MRASIFLSCVALAGAGLAWRGVQADEPRAPNGNIAGEVRAFAVDQGDRCVLRELHRAGWLDATGQTLSTGDFPAALREVWPRVDI